MKKMLSVGDVGDDVAGVHELLESQGLSLPASEVERKFFGPATREALRAFQIANGIDPSCEVCEKTASLLREGAGTKLAAALPPTSRSTGMSLAITAAPHDSASMTGKPNPSDSLVSRTACERR